jgi:arylsulfatase A-like enzyme
VAAHNAPPSAGLAAALLAALVACGGPAEAPRQRPSVLLVVADSLHARHVGAWGHDRPTTPRIDALARDGLRFERACSQSSWTLPSVATLLTSLEQERHGLRTLEGALPAQPETLPELFARAGWRTQAIVQTPVLGSARGLRRGFEGYRVLPFGNEASDEAVERTLRAFEAADGAPLFAYLHLSPPHMPYQPPAPWRGRFSAGTGGDAAVDGSIASCRGAHELGLAPDHPDVLRLAALYDEHVAYADASIGRLLDGLEGLPSARDLLVVVTSDHGEAFLQHGAQGHNAQVYEEMLHVPLVVAGRGSVEVPRGVVAVPVSLLDLLPTLVDLLDLPAPRQTPQGRSLAALLRGEPLDLPPRPLFLSSRYKPRPADVQLGLRQGDLKLVLSGDGARCELYDLAADPYERVDLAARRPADVERLRTRLWAWYADRVPAAPPGAEGQPTPQQQDALRALGY